MNRFVLILAIPLLSTACARRGGSGGDDDDDNGYDFGALDDNGDGALTWEDVASGTAAALFTIPGAESESDVPASDMSLSMYPSSGGEWTMSGGFTNNDVYWYFSVRFENGESSLEEAMGDVTSASLGAKTSMGQYFYSSSPGGSIQVSQVGDGTGSGQTVGEITIEELDPSTEAPTGNVATLRGLAWADVYWGSPDAM